MVPQRDLAVVVDSGCCLPDSLIREWGITVIPHHAFLDSLDYLRRGGRVGKLPALAGDLLGIKPIAELSMVETRLAGKPRGRGPGRGPFGGLDAAEGRAQPRKSQRNVGGRPPMRQRYYYTALPTSLNAWRRSLASLPRSWAPTLVRAFWESRSMWTR